MYACGRTRVQINKRVILNFPTLLLRVDICKVDISKDFYIENHADILGRIYRPIHCRIYSRVDISGAGYMQGDISVHAGYMQGDIS